VVVVKPPRRVGHHESLHLPWTGRATGPAAVDPARFFPAWLSEHGQLVAHQSFRGVSVSLYEVAYD
jgi:hypothetical protein